jgi:DNA-binding CsgD family transcriptional regulator
VSHVILTRRQFEVAELLARGMTYAEIGERLGISWRTVEIHARLARKRAGVRTNAALTSRTRRRAPSAHARPTKDIPVQ